jgi:penicillin-binding protein A
MAMVAAGVANNGVVMEPQVVDRILSPKGSIVVRSKPDELGRAMKQETARTIASMMREAVESGTGTAARLSGLVVAGKTGTAETGVEGTNNAWFICFAGPEGEVPEVAIAVVLEQQNGTGGVLAAPVAREVMQALLPEAANS